MQLPQPLFCLLLERLGRGGEVGVFIAEELVGDLPREEDPDIRLFVDSFTQQVHAHAGPDGGDVVGAQHLDDPLQAGEHILPGDDDLGVVAADVVCRFSGVSQVDGVGVHADGEGLDGSPAPAGGDGAHQGGVQPPGQEEAHLGVSHQPLLHPGDQFFPDVGTDRLQVVPADPVHLCNIPVADKFAVLIVVSRREGQDLIRQAQQVLGLAGKEDGPLTVVPVVEGPDADGVPGGDELSCLPVIEDTGELRVQHGEHICAMLPVQGQEDLTVRAAAEGVPLFLQRLLPPLKAVDLAVAHGPAPLQPEGLHPLRGQAHDGQAVEAQQALPRLDHTAVVGAPAAGAVESGLNGGHTGHRAAISNDRTHDGPLRFLDRSCRDGHRPPLQKHTGICGRMISAPAMLTAPQRAGRRKWGRASIFSR